AAPEPIQNGERSTATGWPEVGGTGTRLGGGAMGRTFCGPRPLPQSSGRAGTPPFYFSPMPLGPPPPGPPVPPPPPSLSLLLLLSACGGRAGSGTAIAVAPESGEAHLRNIRQLTFGGNNAEAYFSRDGRKVIFQRQEQVDQGCDQEYIMNIDGSGVRRISN